MRTIVLLLLLIALAQVTAHGYARAKDRTRTGPPKVRLSSSRHLAQQHELKWTADEFYLPQPETAAEPDHPAEEIVERNDSVMSDSPLTKSEGGAETVERNDSVVSESSITKRGAGTVRGLPDEIWQAIFALVDTEYHGAIGPDARHLTRTSKQLAAIGRAHLQERKLRSTLGAVPLPSECARVSGVHLLFNAYNQRHYILPPSRLSTSTAFFARPKLPEQTSLCLQALLQALPEAFLIFPMTWWEGLTTIYSRTVHHDRYNSRITTSFFDAFAQMPFVPFVRHISLKPLDTSVTSTKKYQGTSFGDVWSRFWLEARRLMPHLQSVEFNDLIAASQWRLYTKRPEVSSGRIPFDFNPFDTTVVPMERPSLQTTLGTFPVAENALLPPTRKVHFYQCGNKADMNVFRTGQGRILMTFRSHLFLGEHPARQFLVELPHHRLMREPMEGEEVFLSATAVSEEHSAERGAERYPRYYIHLDEQPLEDADVQFRYDDMVDQPGGQRFRRSNVRCHVTNVIRTPYESYEPIQDGKNATMTTTTPQATLTMLHSYEIECVAAADRVTVGGTLLSINTGEESEESEESEEDEAGSSYEDENGV